MCASRGLRAFQGKRKTKKKPKTFHPQTHFKLTAYFSYTVIIHLKTEDWQSPVQSPYVQMYFCHSFLQKVRIMSTGIASLPHQGHIKAVRMLLETPEKKKRELQSRLLDP